ncbi:MAG: glutamate formimidoyltransferase, partial [Proteobacteria bacterium]|nr:glutamate formimidoyltransferase [Pseudomonadota bacterium]
MESIVECVPNISEGKDQSLIAKVGASVSAVEGVKLLGIEPDKDYNRSVVTFVGNPEEVLEAAVRLTRTASSLIDMRLHKGEHPRIGAVDVVPFVPIAGVTMQDCVQLARRYGETVSRDLKIPVYLYEAAAASPARRNLADIRKGEYEGLPKKLQDPLWKPDFGQPLFNERSGVTVAGARTFLIAYNVNLSTPDSAIAHEIALRIRESGRTKKDAAGVSVRDANGKTMKIPGTLKAVKAMGVFLERHNIAQVSINLVDFEATPPHEAFEEVKRQAKTLGAEATGSEIVGLTPLKALLLAGNFYRQLGEASAKLSEGELVELAISRVGLSQLE